jgi:hypothetical protein
VLFLGAEHHAKDHEADSAACDSSSACVRHRAGSWLRGAPTRLWNLTQDTIAEFYLAPVGTTQWGPNQCMNDKDGTVDPDERLRITGVKSGVYHARFVDVKGRSCMVHNISVEEGKIF